MDHMDAAETSAPEDQASPPPAETQDGERRCLVSGEMLPKERMIRFVIGPDDAVVPDLAQNLPGRGLWVAADYEAIKIAAKKALFAKAAKASAKSSPELADQVTQLLRARCLSFLGMAKGAGVTVLGETQVETAIRAQKLSLLLIADDAKADLDRRNPINECHLFTRAELGAALGYAQIVYAGLRPHGITKRLYTEIKRFTQLLETAPSTHLDTTDQTQQTETDSKVL